MLFILFAYPHSLSIEKLFKCETFMNYFNGKLCASSLQNRFSPLNQSVTLFPGSEYHPRTKLIPVFSTPFVYLPALQNSHCKKIKDGL